MTWTWTVPDVLLSADERSLLACARRLGRGFGDSIPLLAIADALGWPAAQARAAADRLVEQHDDRVDVGLGDGDDLVFVDG